LKIKKVKLEDKPDGAWLSAVFSDGNQCCINVQNKADSLYKIMVGNNPPKSNFKEPPNSTPSAEQQTKAKIATNLNDILKNYECGDAVDSMVSECLSLL